MTKISGSHLITSRQKGGLDRLFVLGATAVFIIFILCSLYALALTPANPASWSMFVFFTLGLALLLIFEDNALPDLQKRKAPYAFAGWFFTWMFVAVLVSFFITMNLAHLGIAAMFGTIAFFLLTYTVAPEEKWMSFKQSVKTNTAGKVKKKFKSRKPKNKKPKKKKKKRKIAGF